MAMINFRTLQVWEKAHLFTLELYKVSQSFPKEELYGLTSQMRRAAVWIPSNIAEGCGRDSDPELARFAQIAMASASEVEYQLLLAYDLKYLTKEEYQQLDKNLGEVKRMLNTFITRVRARIQT